MDIESLIVNLIHLALARSKLTSITKRLKFALLRVTALFYTTAGALEVERKVSIQVSWDRNPGHQSIFTFWTSIGCFLDYDVKL